MFKVRIDSSLPLRRERTSSTFLCPSRGANLDGMFSMFVAERRAVLDDLAQLRN